MDGSRDLEACLNGHVWTQLGAGPHTKRAFSLRRTDEHGVVDVHLITEGGKVLHFPTGYSGEWFRSSLPRLEAKIRKHLASNVGMQEVNGELFAQLEEAFGERETYPAKVGMNFFARDVFNSAELYFEGEDSAYHPVVGVTYKALFDKYPSVNVVSFEREIMRNLGLLGMEQASWTMMVAQWQELAREHPSLKTNPRLYFDLLKHSTYVTQECGVKPDSFAVRQRREDGPNTALDLALLRGDELLHVSDPAYRAGHYRLKSGGELFVQMEEMLTEAGLNQTGFPKIPEEKPTLIKRAA